jgi:hypothetical protein
MKVWRVHLRPDAEDINPVKVCIEQGIIGIGWRVSRKPKNCDEYMELGKNEYGNKGWSRAAKAICRKMSIGDLVWVRDFYGAYYIGKITGEWEYRDDPKNLKADIINVRPCKLYRVGTNIAGKIINSFRPSATVQQIHDLTAELFSIFVFNKVAGDNIPFSEVKYVDIFSLLSDVDIEDIVGIYLQKTKNYIFVPSSRSRQNSTIAYEYQLIDPKTGMPIYIQVKSGNVILDPQNYYNFPDTYYLFSPAGYARPSTQKHVICLSREEIEQFLISSKSILPLNISSWIEMQELLSEQK